MFHLDPDSHTPLYRQIAAEVIRAIDEGRLGPGDPLPSVRRLAAAHGISTNTVLQAYRELTRAGIALPRRGKGLYVAAAPPPSADRMLAERKVRETIRGVRELPITPDEVLEIVREELGES